MKINKSIFIKLSIYLMALRSPLIILTMVAYILGRNGVIKHSIFKIIPFIIFIILAIIYSVANGNDIGNVLGQSRDILLAIIVSVFLIASCSVSDENRTLIYRTIKYCFVYISLAKILILVFSISTGVAMGDIISWLRDTWNIQMMSLGVEGTFISRLQIPLDSAVPFFIYFVTREFIHTEHNKTNTSITLLLLIISMILTLSRAFWAETALMIMLAVFIEAKTSRILKIVITSSLLLAILIIFTPLGDFLSKIIATRFDNASNNLASDELRVWQNRALIAAFMESPIIGNGLGYYVPNAIRSYTTKYLYESQSLSMLMTLGIVGCVVFMAILLSMCLSIVSKEGKLGIYKYFMPSVFIAMWIFSGSVNPLLFGASGGVIIFMIAKFHTIYKYGDS